MAATTKKQSILKTQKDLLDASLFCDCSFEFLVDGQKQVIKAHRNYLVNTSPVFDKMFTGGLAQSNTIVIDDIPFTIFKDILDYMYTGDIKLEYSQVSDFLYDAVKYDLPELVGKCFKFGWGQQLSPANIKKGFGPLSRSGPTTFSERLAESPRESVDLGADSDDEVGLFMRDLHTVLQQL